MHTRRIEMGSLHMRLQNKIPHWGGWHQNNKLAFNIFRVSFPLVQEKETDESLVDPWSNLRGCMKHRWWEKCCISNT